MSYTYEGMIKITFLEAVKMFNEGLEVFKLYDDNSEGLAESLNEIIDHNIYGGEFGYE